MFTVSRYMDADLASGTIVKVIGLTRYMGHTYVDVLLNDGKRMVYMDAEYVALTGEIARERYNYSTLNSDALWAGV